MTVQEFSKVWEPFVLRAVREIVRRFPGTFNQGTYPGHEPTESRAVDFMVPIDPKRGSLGYRISRWLGNEEVARRLGIWYVIYYGEIWSMTGDRRNQKGTGRTGEKGWLHYFNADNPNNSKAHRNHVHVSFYTSAPGPWYETADPVKPKASLTQYTVTAHGGLYGLHGPGPSTVKVNARNNPRGHHLWIARIVTGRDGRKWGVTRWGTYYSMDYLKKGSQL